MLDGLTRSLKKVLLSAGIEVRRFAPNTSPSAQLVAALRFNKIDLVFDIGANAGQFAKELRNDGYNGRIVSFEPLTTAHSIVKRGSQFDPNWQVPERCAIGAQVGEISLNISGNSVSSSVLPMLSSHRNAAPDSAYVGTELAPLNTFDTVARRFLGEAQTPHLKIDTQGYEWPDLDGAVESLPLMRGVIIELSLLPLYGGQRLWRKCADRLAADEFVLWAILPVFVGPIDGRTLQMDGIFFRQ